MMTTIAKRAPILTLICALALPATAAAEANWGDLFPLLGKVILLAPFFEIARFSYNLWPLMLGLAVLVWLVRGLVIMMGWSDRIDEGIGSGSLTGLLGYLLRPWLITTLAMVTVLVGVVAGMVIKPEYLQYQRTSWWRPWQMLQPAPKPVGNARPTVPFTLADGRAWPKAATEFTQAGSWSAEYLGKYALEVDNRSGESDVYVKLCAIEVPGCPPVRSMFIPKGASLTVKTLAGGYYRLHYRVIDDAGRLARSRNFKLPGATAAPHGEEPKHRDADQGSFEHGNEQQAALIRLPVSWISVESNPAGAMFNRIRPEDF